MAIGTLLCCKACFSSAISDDKPPYGFRSSASLMAGHRAASGGHMSAAQTARRPRRVAAALLASCGAAARGGGRAALNFPKNLETTRSKTAPGRRSHSHHLVLFPATRVVPSFAHAKMPVTMKGKPAPTSLKQEIAQAKQREAEVRSVFEKCVCRHFVGAATPA